MHAIPGFEEAHAWCSAGCNAVFHCHARRFITGDMHIAALLQANKAVPLYGGRERLSRGYWDRGGTAARSGGGSKRCRHDGLKSSGGNPRRKEAEGGPVGAIGRYKGTISHFLFL